MVGGSDWGVGGLAVAYRGGTNQGAELAEISRVAMYPQVMSSLYFVNRLGGETIRSKTHLLEFVAL